MRQETKHITMTLSLQQKQLCWVPCTFVQQHQNQQQLEHLK